MVAAAAGPTAVSKHPSLHGDTLNPSRRPLIPSEKDNAAVSRRPRTRQITSRYLSSSVITTSSSSSGAGVRRYPSPSTLLTPFSSTPDALQTPRRSSSTGRVRVRPDLAIAEPPASAPRAVSTTTRSLSVSFQGESFFYQTSKAREASPKSIPERRRASTPTRATKQAAAAGSDHSDNSRPSDRWPAALPRQSNTVARSLDCSDEKEPILNSIRLLQQNMVFDDGLRRRGSFDRGELSASSDTDSVSSGSNSGAVEVSTPLQTRTAASRGICIPMRFWQENNSRLRHPPESSAQLSFTDSKAVPSPMMAAVKKSFVENNVMSPRQVSSPLHGPIRPSSPSRTMGPVRQSSPSRIVDTRARGVASPLRARGTALANAPFVAQPANAPSIINFAAEVRRAKKGENRIEEAHMLRLLDNRHLQWRFMNASATDALMVQQLAIEKNLYYAWITTSRMHDSVTIKKIKLQMLTQNLRLTSILKGQIVYLEEWSLVERDHSSSLSGAFEALKASTLRLPVVDGARADLQEVKDAVGSAVDVMQSMGSSICYLLSKVEGTSLLVSELTKVAAHEQALLDQSRELLSKLAALHVTQCSLQGHLLQLKCRPSQMQL